MREKRERERRREKGRQEGDSARESIPKGSGEGSHKERKMDRELLPIRAMQAGSLSYGKGEDHFGELLLLMDRSTCLDFTRMVKLPQEVEHYGSTVLYWIRMAEKKSLKKYFTVQCTNTYIYVSINACVNTLREESV